MLCADGVKEWCVRVLCADFVLCLNVVLCSDEYCVQMFCASGEHRVQMVEGRVAPALLACPLYMHACQVMGRK
jgi:hypothetical protein